MERDVKICITLKIKVILSAPALRVVPLWLLTKNNTIAWGPLLQDEAPPK